MVNRNIVLLSALGLVWPVTAMAAPANKAAVRAVECQLAGCDDGARATADDLADSQVICRPGAKCEAGFTLGRPVGVAEQRRTRASNPVRAASNHSRRRAAPYAAATAAAVAQPVGTADMLLTFPLGSADLTSAAAARAQVFAEALNGQRLNTARFVIEGHTDRQGTAAYNQDLSRRRAQSVVDYLVSHGISADRLSARGYGADRLRDVANPRDGVNRRVEIVKVG